MPRFGNIWICCLGSESVPCRTALQWLKEDHQPTFPSASCFVFLSPWIVFVHLSDDNQGKVSIWQTFSKKKRPNKPQTCQHPPPPGFVWKIWKCQKTCLETTNSLGALTFALWPSWRSDRAAEKKGERSLTVWDSYFAAPSNTWFQAEMSCHLSASYEHQMHSDRPLKTQRPSITISQRAAFGQQWPEIHHDS